jgi:amidase/aspartyl-tRNA(Asn)/glutamyl-tRNA(Gln) amidotransferase subunit A
VRDAMLVHEILSQRPITRSDAPLGAYRLGIAQALMQEALDPTVAQAWDRTVSALAQAGARITEVALAPLQALADIQIAGGLVATESYAWHRPRLQDKAALYDPRVAQRIQRGARTTAAEYIAMLQARAQWIQDMQRAMQGFDAFLSPTVACVAPPIESVAASPEKDPAFFQLNALLLRNTSVVNMLDGCAISIPCHQPNEQPVGLMIWAPNSCDDTVLNVARQIENLLRPS